MFTGIVEALASVAELAARDSETRLVVSGCTALLEDTKLGDSINVNGVCLTVTKIETADASFTFDLSPETLSRTALGALKPGSLVNLERAIAPKSRFGGHFVQVITPATSKIYCHIVLLSLMLGHVDTTATIRSIRQEPPNSVIFTFHLPQSSTEQLPDAFTFIVPKGFITLDGTSLTVIRADSQAKEFSVMLIPYTLEHINLGRLAVGDKVNVEVDVVGKYVDRVVRNLHANSSGTSTPPTGAPSSERIATAHQQALGSLPASVADRVAGDEEALRALEGVVEKVVKANFEERVAAAGGAAASAQKHRFDTIEDALKDFAEGKFLIVVDDEDRENEGDLIIAAQFMTQEKMAFLIRYSSGLVCAPMTYERLEELNLPLMVSNNDNKEYMGTAFTVTVDLIGETTTGISAADRAATVRGLADPKRKAADFARPGHILPLRAHRGGVLKRTGHTEAAVDLCKLSGLTPVGVICEIVKDDGEMARRDDLEVFAKKFGIKMITIADMAKYRLKNTLEGCNVDAKMKRRSSLIPKETVDIHEHTGSTYVLREGNTLTEPGTKTKSWLGGASWREERDYIGADIFCPGYYADITGDLTNSESLKTEVRKHAQEEYDSYTGDLTKRPSLSAFKKKTWEKLHREVGGLIADMSSLTALHLMEFVVNNILQRMYHQGIHIRESEIIEMKKWARKGEEEKLSMIFLPSHKSHIDYLVISYILFRLGIALPHIAAGNNLCVRDLPVVGPVLRKCGAFFIRRGGWGDTPLYSVLVREYIDLLLKKGHNIEVFIEGTRSRTGKLLTPRFGILKMIQESVLYGRTKDCIIVPLSIGYDNVVETSTYATELLGGEKTPESLAGIASASRVLGLRLGRIDIRFAKPYLMSEFIKQEIATDRRPHFNPATNTEHRQLLLQSFGFQILSNINAVSVVMPTALVGTVLLTLRGNGVGREELIRRVTWLRGEVIGKGGTVADFGGMTTPVVVDRALSVIRDYIGERKGLLEPVYYAIKPFELSLYRNNVINLFVSESILTLSMYISIKKWVYFLLACLVNSDYKLVMTSRTVSPSALAIARIIAGEFIYQPGKLESTVWGTLKYLEEKAVVSVERTGFGDSLNGTVALSKEEVTNGRETYDLFCFLLWPFVEAYWVATVGLFTLVNDGGGSSDWVDEGTLMARLQMFGRTLYYEGDLVTMEAYNKETLKNALARLQEMGVIVGRKSRPLASITPASRGTSSVGTVMPPQTASKSPAHTFLALHPDYIPPLGFLDQPSGTLWELVKRIGQYRREGKQRRDNMSVSNRVLRMTRLAASWRPSKKTILERLHASKEVRTEAAREREYEEEMEESEAVESLMMGGVHNAKL
ncbi:hypothetical protein HDU93_000969 [Gonapodya sp. JEL0774]|nr:hypothetical protein HDU93_000969 [Gonapodya sp. JEL0774]